MPIFILPAAPALQSAASQPCLFYPAHRFLLPGGWKATPVEGGKVVLTPPDAGDNQIIVLGPAPPDAVAALQEADPAAAVQKVFVEMASDAVPVGTPRRLHSPLGDGVALSFRGESEGVELTVHVWLCGRDGKATVLMCAGPTAKAVPLKPALDRLFASVTPASAASGKKSPPAKKPAPPAKKPAASSGKKAAATGPAGDGSAAVKAWVARLSGATLVSEKTNFRDGSGESTRAAIRFAPNGTFTATLRRTISINVGGAYAGSGLSDKTTEGAGKWRVERAGGTVYLVLVEKEGASRLKLEQKGRIVTLDGGPVTLSR